MSNADLIKKCREAAECYDEGIDVEGISEALKEAADALEAHDWRDIDSAPKDGTWVLLFDPKSQEQVKARFSMDADFDFWEASDSSFIYWDGTNRPDPTHWKPLNTPPDTQNT